MNNREYEDTLSLRELARLPPDPEPAPSPASRVFVIDDEEGVCKFIALAVTSLGYQADTFTNAQLALRALTNYSPAIIFLDVALAGSDAIDVLRKLDELGYRGVVQLMSGSNQSILQDV